MTERRRKEGEEGGRRRCGALSLQSEDPTPQEVRDKN